MMVSPRKSKSLFDGVCARRGVGNKVIGKPSAIFGSVFICRCGECRANGSEEKYYGGSHARLKSMPFLGSPDQ